MTLPKSAPFPNSPRRTILALACTAAAAALLSGCAAIQALVQPPAQASAAGPMLVPPTAMRVEGVPALSAAVLGPIQRCSQEVGHGVVDWHPQRREMLVAHRLPGSSTTQIFRLRSPLGALEPLTDSPDPVSNARWEPSQGRHIVFARGTGGDEVFKLFRLDPEARVTTPITPSGQRHAFAAWVAGPAGQPARFLYISVPIDRTAQGGTRASISTTLNLVDPMNPPGARAVAELPGGGWGNVEVTPDGRQPATTNYVSATRSEVWLIAIDRMATHPRLDAQRVVVGGGSYGGYMALAPSVRLADRIAGAASTVGISNFVSFLERTESYRRDLRRVEYGDERDPAMRAFMEGIAPLNLSDRINKPLLVAQGKNDPRVPWTESEQIVRKLQARNSPVWYLLADNEGHGFARRENTDFYFATPVRFLQDTVLTK